MWHALRNRKQDGLKFRREHPIGGYVADFYCSEHHLIIEIDGDVHDDPSRKANDRIRQEHLEKAGNRVIRVTVEEVNINIDAVIEKIVNACKGPHPSPLPEYRGRRE